MPLPDPSLKDRLVREGYAFVQAATMRQLLFRYGDLSDWEQFTASWNHLGLDTYMADHGRYRRRRYAVYAASEDGAIERQPHQPHFQTLDYNRLHGGIERWFDPIDAAIGDGQSLRTLLGFCHDLFGSLATQTRRWHIEAHQFRIEARAGEQGLPTPEGMHRDGVDYVLVLLIQRVNIASGTTLIGTTQEGFFSSFTLTEPFDAALLDDERVYHGVTPVQALDPSLPAYRDVLVLTFRDALMSTWLA